MRLIILGSHPPGGHLLVFSQRHEYAPGLPAEHPQPSLQRTNRAQLEVRGIENGLFFGLAQLVGLALVERHDEPFFVEGQIFNIGLG
jgi:hypothetical protein